MGLQGRKVHVVDRLLKAFKGPILIATSLLFLWGSVSSATASLNYHGRIVKPNGSAFEPNSATLKIQIRSTGSEDCLMWEETYSGVDMTGTGGVFSLNLNSGTGVRTDGSGLTFAQVFGNYPTTTMTVPLANCTGGSNVITLTSNSHRVARLLFKDSLMSSFEQTPDMALAYVPFSMDSQKVGGFTPASLLRVEDASGPQAAAAFTPVEFAELQALIAGSSTQYEQAGKLNGQMIPALSNGNVLQWQGGAWTAVTPVTSESDPNTRAYAKADLPSCAANEFLQSTGANTWVCTGVTGASGGTVTSITVGSGLVDGSNNTGTSILTTGTIALPDLVTAGTGTKVTYDAKGRITASTTLAESDIPTLSTAGKVSGDAITSGTIAGSTAINTSGTISSGSITSSGIVTSGSLVLRDGDTNTVTLQTPADVTANYVLTLPLDDGNSGEVLTTNGSGVLSWAAAASATSVAASAGSAASPSMSFSGDSNTGFYNTAADQIGVATNGAQIFNFSSGGLTSPTTGGGTMTTANGTASAPTFSFTGDEDTGWYRPAADTLAAATGGAEQVRIDSSGNMTVYDNYIYGDSTNPYLQLTNATGAKLGYASANTYLVVGGDIQFTRGGQNLGVVNDRGWGLGAGGTLTNLTVGDSYPFTISNAGVNTNPSIDTFLFQNAYVYNNSGSLEYRYSTNHGSYGARGLGLSYNDGITFYAQNAATTANASFTPTPRMLIKNDGKIGIGTTAPAAHVDLQATVSNTIQDGMLITANAPSDNSGAVLSLKRYRDDMTGGGASNQGNQTVLRLETPSNLNYAYYQDLISAYHDTTKVFNVRHDGNTTMTSGRATESFIVNGTYGDGIADSGGDHFLWVSGFNVNDHIIGIRNQNWYTSIGAMGIELGESSGAFGNYNIKFKTGSVGDLILLGNGVGSVGIGSTTPVAKLDVAGEVKFGNTSSTCNSTTEGQQRYNSTSKKMEFCNATAWTEYGTGTSTSPAGIVVASAAASCPTGYLLANGSAVSRTTYAALFTSIGVMYGSGDGSTTFNLPDYRGYFLRATDGGAARDPSAASRTNRGDGTTGDNVGTKQSQGTAANGLSVSVNNAQGYSGSAGWGYGTNNVAFGAVTASVSSTDAETRPVNINVNYCISTGS